MYVVVYMPLDRGSYKGPKSLMKPLYKRGFKHICIHTYAHFGLFPTDTEVLLKAPIKKGFCNGPVEKEL